MPSRMANGQEGLIEKVAKGGGDYVKAEGTLTVDTQPDVGDTITIGEKTYTVVTDETANEDGEVDAGADLADFKTLVVAAINGSDGINTAHPLVTIGSFSSDDAVVTAIRPGTRGNSIATTETFTTGTNVFDAATLGTTTPGTGNDEVVAAVTGRIIRVLSMLVSNNGTTKVQATLESDITAISGDQTLASDGGGYSNGREFAGIETSRGEALNLKLSDEGSVDFDLVYREI